MKIMNASGTLIDPFNLKTEDFDPERGISCMSYDLKHYVIAD